MNPLVITKIVAGFVTSTAVGTVVTNGVKTMAAPAAKSILEKGLVVVGTFIISGMVGEKACDYVDEKIDEIDDKIRNM